MAMSDTAIQPSKTALDAEARSWASRARELQIVDRESCINASTLLRSVKTLRNQVQQWFAPHIEAAMETKRKAEAARKALADERDKMEAPLVEAENVLKRGLLKWETQQEEARLAEERRLQAEAQARAEALTLAAAAAMESEAVATSNSELMREAEDILAQPIDAPVVMVKTMVPKVDGISYRDNWKAHPTVDIKALAAAVADGTAPISFLTANMTAINQFGRATQGTQPVPGIRWFNDRQIAARG
jgi:hypothetical protein